MPSELNDKIHGILDDVFYENTQRWEAANEIEKLVLQEQLDLLSNFYYGEDLKIDDILKLYTSLKDELTSELTQQLNELNK